MDYYNPLPADNTYHITARAIGSEKLFLNDDNYQFFLTRYDKYITPLPKRLPGLFYPIIFICLFK